MELRRLAMNFTVCQIASLDYVDFAREFVFLSKTDEELSLVCETEFVPKNVLAAEAGWQALKISGVLDFGMIGVIANISSILAQANVGIFVVSTYNTDYILIKAENMAKSVAVLAANGYILA